MAAISGAIIARTGGVDYPVRPDGLSLKDPVRAPAELEVKVRPVSGQGVPQPQRAIILLVGTTEIFTGIIYDVIDDDAPNQPHDYIIMAEDYSKIFQYTDINRSWRDASLKTIVSGALDRVNLVSLDPDAEEGPTYDRITANNLLVHDLFLALSDLSRRLFRVDNAGLFHIDAFGSSPTETINQTDIFGRVAPSREAREYFNRVLVVGQSEEEEPRTVIFNGDGNQRTFSLPLPVGGDVSIQVDSLPQDVGVVGNNHHWSYEQGGSVISVEVAPDEGSIISVFYTGIISSTFEEKLDAEVKRVGSYTRILRPTGVFREDEVRQQARAQLRKYGNPWAHITISLLDRSYYAGQTVRLNLDQLKGIYLIENVEYQTYGGNKTVVTLQLTDSEGEEYWDEFFRGSDKLDLSGPLLTENIDALVITDNVSIGLQPDDPNTVLDNEVDIFSSPSSTPRNKPTAVITKDPDLFRYKSGSEVILSGSQSTAISGRRIEAYQWYIQENPGDNPIEIPNPGASSNRITMPFVRAVSDVVIRLLVFDNQGGVDDETIRLSVEPATDALSEVRPIANAGADQIVNGGATVTLDASGSSDFDGSIVRTTWVQTSGTQVVLSDNSVRRPTFQAPAATRIPQRLQFRLMVEDDSGLEDQDIVVITVRAATTAVNRQPVANAGPDQTVSGGATVTLNSTGSSDPDGTIASRSWEQTSGPTVELSDSTAVSPTFDAPATTEQAQTLVFQLEVEDNLGATNTDIVTITVSGTGEVANNVAPTAEAGTNRSFSTSVNRDATLDGSGSTDPDGQIVAYNWVQTKGSKVTIDDPDAVNTTYRLPAQTKVRQEFEFQLTVTDDDGATATDKVSHFIEPIPDPPTADAGDDQTINVNATRNISLDGTGSTAVTGRTIDSYEWESDLEAHSDMTGAEPTFVIPNNFNSGRIVFTLTVTDNLGQTDTDTVTITVTEIALNQPPVAEAGPNKTLSYINRTTLEGSGSDPDGSVRSYSWSPGIWLAPGIGGSNTARLLSLSSTAVARPTVTPVPLASASGSQVLTLTVTDDEGATDSDTVQLTWGRPSESISGDPIRQSNHVAYYSFFSNLHKRIGTTPNHAAFSNSTATLRSVAKVSGDATGRRAGNLSGAPLEITRGNARQDSAFDVKYRITFGDATWVEKTVRLIFEF
ncbi:MAG: hypothetical protein OXU36_10595 [Candidatus Poribacteria bacterium]|nr:hypothetical protein [Candidatus Poribacteria bacterium]